MTVQSLCVKIPRQYGEKALILVNRLKIIDRRLMIQRDEKAIYIPLLRLLSDGELQTLDMTVSDYGILEYSFPEKNTREATFAGLLADKVPRDLLASLPRAVDFVGDLATVQIPPQLGAYESVIGEAILGSNRKVRTVLAKMGAVDGTYRLREFKVIAGKPETSTIHKEYGCRFCVDVTKAYFSPRLSHEHKRVASLVNDDETVVDMFAGVGPFSIQIAKLHRSVKVYSIDMNPYAIEFAKRNIRLNRVEGQVHVILGDAKEAAKDQLSGIADRVIMNLPGKAIEFVGAACGILKSEGGMIHFYCFVSASNPLDGVRHVFTDAVEKNGRKVMEVLLSRRVRETAPYECQAVLDARIQ